MSSSRQRFGTLQVTSNAVPGSRACGLPWFCQRSGRPRDWEGDFDAEAAVWPGLDEQGGAVGFSDGLHDGQAEAEPPAVPGPIGAQPLERAQ